MSMAGPTDIEKREVEDSLEKCTKGAFRECDPVVLSCAGAGGSDCVSGRWMSMKKGAQRWVGMMMLLLSTSKGGLKALKAEGSSVLVCWYRKQSVGNRDSLSRPVSAITVLPRCRKTSNLDGHSIKLRLNFYSPFKFFIAVLK